MIDGRQLKDLAGVGPATISDLRILGVHSVAELSRQDGDELYERLCLRTGKQHDICCLDVLCCAVAQARDHNLPKEQRNWWYWSALRKRRQSVIN
jgi:nucleotidyltransferase/DNA polymerase involved in DNA repair